jgi:hypothetical protein
MTIPGPQSKGGEEISGRHGPFSARRTNAQTLIAFDEPCLIISYHLLTFLARRFPYDYPTEFLRFE